MESLGILYEEEDAVWYFFFHEGLVLDLSWEKFSSLSFEAVWFVIMWNLHKQVTELAKL